MPTYDARAAEGFTLIETMIAIAVLTLGVAGPLFVAERAVVAAQTARDHLVASYLAQEGIEYARAMRDHEFLASYSDGGSSVSQTAWDAFVVGTGAHGGSIAGCENQTCALDPARPMGTGNGLALVPCTADSCVPLSLSGGAYNEQGVGVATPYTRTLQAAYNASSPNDVSITSVVAWTARGTTYRVSITDHLTPWQ